MASARSILLAFLFAILCALTIRWPRHMGFLGTLLMTALGAYLGYTIGGIVLSIIFALTVFLAFHYKVAQTLILEVISSILPT